MPQALHYVKVNIVFASFAYVIVTGAEINRTTLQIVILKSRKVKHLVQQDGVATNPRRPWASRFPY